MTRAARRHLFWALPFMLSTACYRYVPLESPQRGMDVRAQLTSEAAVRRSQGREEPVLRYHGMIVGFTPDSLALDVLVARSSGAVQDVVIRDTVSIATAEIQTLMRRKLSVGRTTLFTLAAGAGAAVVVMGVDQIVGGTDPKDDGGTPNLRTPLFSWQTLRLALGFW